MGKPVASEEPQAKPDQDDDDLPTLNINQLTGVTDEEGNFVDEF